MNPMRLIGVLLGVSWMTGCGDGHSTTMSSPAFSYNGSRPFPAVVGETIALTPAVSGPMEQYAVSPGLPPGLSLDGSTGVISGTPTQASGATIFTVTATYQGVRSASALVLSVTEPPNHLSYASPAEGSVGTSLRPLRPRIAGTVDHYAVTPALPPGVMLDSTSGLITGTPTRASPLAPYTITANSLSGNTSFILLLTITAPSSRRRH